MALRLAQIVICIDSQHTHPNWSLGQIRLVSQLEFLKHLWTLPSASASPNACHPHLFFYGGLCSKVGAGTTALRHRFPWSIPWAMSYRKPLSSAWAEPLSRLLSITGTNFPLLFICFCLGKQKFGTWFSCIASTPSASSIPPWVKSLCRLSPSLALGFGSEISQ